MIPRVAHFIWFGATYPWVNELAVRSAAERGGFERVILHHDGRLEADVLERLGRLEGFAARPIEPSVAFEGLGVPRLAETYAALERPNARANVIRAALLAKAGGVYLDQDTITLRSMVPLLADDAFCGAECVVWPAHVRRSRRPDVLARALLQDALRAGCAALPRGWRAFRRVQPWFPTAVNNAVLGATPGHPFLLRLLRAMTEVPADRRRVAYALGTHLLQAELADWSDPDHPVRVHPPEVFYPLGPVMSQHWFRRFDGAPLDEIISEQTRVVHWYASVKTRDIVPGIDPEYVRAHDGIELFSSLARPFA